MLITYERRIKERSSISTDCNQSEAIFINKLLAEDFVPDLFQVGAEADNLEILHQLVALGIPYYDVAALHIQAEQVLLLIACEGDQLLSLELFPLV